MDPWRITSQSGRRTLNIIYVTMAYDGQVRSNKLATSEKKLEYRNVRKRINRM